VGKVLKVSVYSKLIKVETAVQKKNLFI